MAEVDASGDQVKETINVESPETKEIVEKLEEIKITQETEERPKVRVVHRGITGKIKWFNSPHGYGFIERNDNEPDVFVHQSAVVRPGRKPRFSLHLKGGEKVEFDVVQGLKGLEAAAVTAPDGYELITSGGFKFNQNGKYHHHGRRKFNQKRNNRKTSSKSSNKPAADENGNTLKDVESGEVVKPAETATPVEK